MKRMKQFKGGRKRQGGWVQLALAAGMMLMGGIEGKENRKAEKENMRLQGFEARKSAFYDAQLQEHLRKQQMWEHRQGLNNFAGFGKKWKSLAGYKPSYVATDPGKMPEPKE